MSRQEHGKKEEKLATLWVRVMGMSEVCCVLFQG